MGSVTNVQNRHYNESAVISSLVAVVGVTE
jgi:hypothetical protein